MLTCDRTQKRHYGDEQGRYWSVSQVLDVLTGGAQWGEETDSQRGTDLHHIFALLLGAAVGWANRPEIPDCYAGYVVAMQAWIACTHPQPEHLERPRKHIRLPYAGMPDYQGVIQSHSGVLDLKTGVPQRWHAVQVRAYKEMVGRADKMWLLYISKAGTYTMRSVRPNPHDWAGFCNALSILQWRNLK